MGAGAVAAAMSGMAAAPGAVAAPADGDASVSPGTGDPAAPKPGKSKGPHSEPDSTPAQGGGAGPDKNQDDDAVDDDGENGAAEDRDKKTDAVEKPDATDVTGEITGSVETTIDDVDEDAAVTVVGDEGDSGTGSVTAPTTTAIAAPPAVIPAVPASAAVEQGDAVVHATASVSLRNSQTQAPVRAPSLINVIGSVVLGLLGGLIHLVDGPPILPANSSVTVRTSTLTLPIGAGRSVQADWYFPTDANESTRLVYLQHGFLASGPLYSFTAARIAEQIHAIVVVPSLSSNFFAPDAAWVGGSTMHRAVAALFEGDRRELTESASTAAGYIVALPQKFALVGHSAGGTLVASAAGHLADSGAIDDLVGVVLLDGVEPAGSHFVSDALAELRGDNDVPVYLISSERYFWSRGGDMADKISLARPGRFNGVGLAGGLHIDYAESGNPIVQLGEYLVAGFSQRKNIDAAGAITVGWLNDLFTGTTTEGLYGTPGQSIPVATSSGTATATVLPLGQPNRPVWPPLLDTILTAIFDFGGRYLFVYDPLLGYQTPALHDVDPPATGMSRLGAGHH